MVGKIISGWKKGIGKKHTKPKMKQRNHWAYSTSNELQTFETLEGAKIFGKI